jgi:hypothetical protein
MNNQTTTQKSNSTGNVMETLLQRHQYHQRRADMYQRAFAVRNTYHKAIADENMSVSEDAFCRLLTNNESLLGSQYGADCTYKAARGYMLDWNAFSHVLYTLEKQKDPLASSWSASVRKGLLYDELFAFDGRERVMERVLNRTLTEQEYAKYCNIEDILGEKCQKRSHRGEST